MACDLPVIPPALSQARQMCAEKSTAAVTGTPEVQAALAGCKQVFENWTKLREPYEKCMATESLANTKAAIDKALKQ